MSATHEAPDNVIADHPGGDVGGPLLEFVVRNLSEAAAHIPSSAGDLTHEGNVFEVNPGQIKEVKQSETPGVAEVTLDPPVKGKYNKEIAFATGLVAVGALITYHHSIRPRREKPAPIVEKLLPNPLTDDKSEKYSIINRLRTSNFKIFKKGKENVEHRLRSLITYGKRSKS